MAKAFSKKFYNSIAWKNTRNAYFTNQFGLCEKCNKPGEEVHHIEALTPANINDPNISLSWDNLMLLCRSCHELIEAKATATRDGIIFTEDGQVMEVQYDTEDSYK